jgi:hypothetical protein
MSTFAQKVPFTALGKYQLALIPLEQHIAFQADDEGSIPFTRSNFLIDLPARGASALPKNQSKQNDRAG